MMQPQEFDDGWRAQLAEQAAPTGCEPKEMKAPGKGSELSPDTPQPRKCTDVAWKLASAPPGVCGPIVRLSDTVAQHKRSGLEALLGHPEDIAAVISATPELLGLFEAEEEEEGGPPGFITGDTPLSSGRHTWRVAVDGLHSNDFLELYGQEVAFGVVEAGRQLKAEDAREDASFYGASTLGVGERYTGGKWSQDSGLGPLRNGDIAELLLDVPGRRLTVATPKDGRSCVFEGLPANVQWVPLFLLCFPGNQVSVEVVRPELDSEQQ